MNLSRKGRGENPDLDTMGIPLNDKTMELCGYNKKIGSFLPLSKISKMWQ